MMSGGSLFAACGCDGPAAQLARKFFVDPAYCSILNSWPVSVNLLLLMIELGKIRCSPSRLSMHAWIHGCG